MEKKLIQKIL